MAIQELTEEQVRTWSLEKKDRWWLENIYRGNAPQLNLRSALTGMLLGGVLSLTNLYVGIRTGWTLGVGITSVILAFVIFKVFASLKIGKEMTILENNAMQSVATSAGYMTAPMVSSLPAYMLVTGHPIPAWHTFWWIIALAILGVLYAFPLKKRFINDEQLPFPEGYAAAVVMDGLHTSKGREGVYKAKLLIGGGLIASVIEFLRNEPVLKAIKLQFLQLPAYWDEFIYKFATPKILGTPLKDLTVRFDSSIVMVGAGGLMGIKAGFSLLLGAVLNYCILAPIMIKKGVIPGSGFKNITMWGLWGGVAMMTTASLYSFFAKPEVFIEAFRTLRKGKRKKKSDVLEGIELPMWIFVVGIPVMGLITVLMGHYFFHFKIWLGLVALPLVFVFTLIAVTSTGLTSITPGSALAKLTQLTYAGLAPGNIPSNIMAAGINSEVSLNASNLLMDIKPGYMLGGKPRHQAVGHVLGIFAGAIVSVPVFYLIFNNDLSLLTSERLPMPSATVWKAVAEVLAKGFGFLHPTAKVAIAIGAALGILFEILNKSMKGRFPITGVGMGLAFVLQFPDSLAMSLGAIFFWAMGKKYRDPKTTVYKMFVENRETISAGIIAGGSLIGITLILIETVFLS